MLLVVCLIFSEENLSFQHSCFLDGVIYVCLLMLLLFFPLQEFQLIESAELAPLRELIEPLTVQY